MNLYDVGIFVLPGSLFMCGRQWIHLGLALRLNFYSALIA